MDIFEEEEMKKMRPIKNTWYNLVINFIPRPIRKSASVLKGKVLNLYKRKHLIKLFLREIHLKNKLFMGEERN